MRSTDIIVIGGGLSGSAIALGLMREGAKKVMLFDEQLPTQRLSRGNFGLTWFMCKGASHPVYAQWSRLACQNWPEFAASLEAETGYNIELNGPAELSMLLVNPKYSKPIQNPLKISRMSVPR